jgi:hypothetical protein
LVKSLTANWVQAKVAIQNNIENWKNGKSGGKVKASKSKSKAKSTKQPTKTKKNTEIAKQKLNLLL